MKRWLVSLLALIPLAGCGGPENPISQIPKQDIPQITPQTSNVVSMTLEQRRDEVERYMRYMMSFLWTVEEPLTYSFKVGSGNPLIDDKRYVATLVPGRIYSGLPYTHGAGDAEAFLSFGEMGEDGICSMTGLTAELISGSGGTQKANNIARIGNDCADAVFCAWARVCSSITFANAGNMTPKNGCIPVGNYKTVGADADKNGITKDICEENGEEVMFEAYAQLQKADGMTTTSSGGSHARLVSEVHVVRNGDKIDPEQSYVLTHEQTSGHMQKNEFRYDVETKQRIFILGGVDQKYTFRQLYKSGYLPVTCRELIDPTPLPEETVTSSNWEPEISQIFSGSLQSNYRIAAVEVSILDKTGNVVQQVVGYGMDATPYGFLLRRFERTMEQRVMNGTLDIDALVPGSYTCRTTCRLGTGVSLIAREFTFTVQ